jgi:protein-tyrosine-phosphatase
MKVHFVCTGNTYRSRLAETYLNSKKLKEIEAFSSGVEADKNLSGPIGWIASRLIYKNRLVNHMTTHWRLTDEYLLGIADHTIFMEQIHFDFCNKNLGFKSSNFEIWNINDLKKGESDLEKIENSEVTFEKIKHNVDELIKKLDSQSNL